MQLLDPKSITPTAESRLLLHQVSWETYEMLVQLFGDDQPGLRMHYLEGSLELWVPGREHERLKKLLARLVEAFGEEFDLDLNGYGSTTFRQQAAARGLEPDECYCLGELKEVPDIAIEIVVTSGLLDRLDIYQGLGIREIWVWQNHNLSFYILESSSGSYQIADRSDLLPQLDPVTLVQFLNETSQTRAVKQYRAQLRADLN